MRRTADGFPLPDRDDMIADHPDRCAGCAGMGYQVTDSPTGSGGWVSEIDACDGDGIFFSPPGFLNPHADGYDPDGL